MRDLIQAIQGFNSENQKRLVSAFELNSENGAALLEECTLQGITREQLVQERDRITLSMVAFIKRVEAARQVLAPETKLSADIKLVFFDAYLRRLLPQDKDTLTHFKAQCRAISDDYDARAQSQSEDDMGCDGNIRFYVSRATSKMLSGEVYAPGEEAEFVIRIIDHLEQQQAEEKQDAANAATSQKIKAILQDQDAVLLMRAIKKNHETYKAALETYLKGKIGQDDLTTSTSQELIKAMVVGSYNFGRAYKNYLSIFQLEETVKNGKLMPKERALAYTAEYQRLLPITSVSDKTLDAAANVFKQFMNYVVRMFRELQWYFSPVNSAEKNYYKFLNGQQNQLRVAPHHESQIHPQPSANPPAPSGP